jgi:hypothetical protein
MIWLQGATCCLSNYLVKRFFFRYSFKGIALIFQTTHLPTQKDLSMKNLLSLTMLFIFAFSLSSSQLSITKGIKGGVTFAGIGGEGGTGSESTTQFCVGGFLEILFPGGASFQPEVLYSVKGFGGTVNLFGTNIKLTQRVSYIDIPMLLKYNLPTPEVGVSFYGGPSLGILLGATLDGEVNGVTSSTDNKDIYGSPDLGIIIGTGVKIPLTTISLTLDARYYFSIKSIDKDGTGKVYNRDASLLAGLAF